MNLKRIMIAEDNQDHVVLTLDALAPSIDEETEVRVARDGREALAVLFDERWVPDLLLLDVQMPLVDGFEVLERVKEDEQLRSVAIVMLTSSADERDRSRSLGLGSERFVTKPVDGAALRELVVPDPVPIVVRGGEPVNDPRCLIADDHPALTSAVSSYLSENGFDIVGPAPDGRRAVALAAEEKPELALVDYRMPRLMGTELIAAIRDASPETRICVYTADGDEALANDVLAAGAVALVLKEAPLADLVRALEAALAGGSYLDPAVARTPGRSSRLTERELAVLRLLAEGLQHEEIGRRLGISSETVRTHLRKASDRLGASTRTQAVATALRMGLIA